MSTRWTAYEQAVNSLDETPELKRVLHGVFAELREDADGRGARWRRRTDSAIAELRRIVGSHTRDVDGPRDVDSPRLIPVTENSGDGLSAWMDEKEADALARGERLEMAERDSVFETPEADLLRASLTEARAHNLRLKREVEEREGHLRTLSLRLEKAFAECGEARQAAETAERELEEASARAFRLGSQVAAIRREVGAVIDRTPEREIPRVSARWLSQVLQRP